MGSPWFDGEMLFRMHLRLKTDWWHWQLLYVTCRKAVYRRSPLLGLCANSGKWSCHSRNYTRSRQLKTDALIANSCTLIVSLFPITNLQGLLTHRPAYVTFISGTRNILIAVSSWTIKSHTRQLSTAQQRKTAVNKPRTQLASSRLIDCICLFVCILQTFTLG